MTLAERLRQIANALPPHGSVTLTRADLDDLLVAEDIAPKQKDENAAGLTLQQVAERLGRSVSTVRGWCSDRRFPNCYRLRGREWRVPVSDIDAMLRLEAERHRKAQEPRTRVGGGLTLSSWRKHVE